MKHLFIDCEHLSNDFPEVDFEEDQHIWLLLYENSNYQLPIHIAKKIFHHIDKISVIRFPKIKAGNFFYFIAFQLGKISSTDSNPSFRLITKQSSLIKQESLLNTLPITISYQGINVNHISLPPPAEKENDHPDLITSQDLSLQVYKLVAYDLFYQKSFFPTLRHNLKNKIYKYYLPQCQNLDLQEGKEKIIEQVINYFERKDYLYITKDDKVHYQLSAESIYQYLINRILQTRPRFYAQIIKMIAAETDFLKLPFERLELLFDKIYERNILVKIDDFIFYFDEENSPQDLYEVAYKVCLNFLAGPKAPKTLAKLLEKLQDFEKLGINLETIIYQLRTKGIVSYDDTGTIIYNDTYKYELEDKFPKILFFLCKAVHHTQPRYQETLVNYIYKVFEQKKIPLYVIYLIYYRLIADGYIINDHGVIHYYLPEVES